MKPSIRLLLGATTLVVGLLSVVRAAVFWSLEAYLDAVSGSWTALAVDLAHGTFYRPLFGPLGYGGTRYFPLHFSLHALLIRCGVDPVAAGLALSAATTALLCAGVARVLRVLGAPRLLAGCCGVLVLASQTTQEALLSIKGDALAAALNLWGFAAAIAEPRTRWTLGAAATGLTLAFAAKPTAVSGLLASVLWLGLSGDRHRALALLASSAAGYAAVATLVIAGGGAAAYGAGGAGWSVATLLAAPWEMARLARQVPETLVFIELGLAASVALLVMRPSRQALAAAALLLSTGLTTAPIFMFEGTDTNHLLDLHAVSVIAMGAWIDAAAADAIFAPTALALAGLAASLSLTSGLAHAAAEQRWGSLAQVLALVADRQGPVLAENPLVPIARGERPYMVDAFMFRLLRERNPALADPLWTALRERRFAAVVLERDPHTERGRVWYQTAYFGPGFIDTLEEGYRIGGRVKARVVYVRRE